MEDIDDTTDSNGYIYIPIEDSDSDDDDPASQLIFQNAHMSYQQILEQDARDEDDIQLNIKMEENEGNLYENDYTGNNEEGVFDAFTKEITDSQLNKAYDEEECNINESYLENENNEEKVDETKEVEEEEKEEEEKQDEEESAIKEPTEDNEIDDDDYKSASDVSKADSVIDIKYSYNYDDICFNHFSPDLSTQPDEPVDDIPIVPTTEKEDLVKNDSKEGDKDFAGFSDEEVDVLEKAVISFFLADGKKSVEKETDELEPVTLSKFKKEASIHEDELLDGLNESTENMEISFETREELEDPPLEEIPDVESIAEENIEIINDPIPSTSFDSSPLRDMEVCTVFSDHDYLSQSEITKMLSENHKRKMLATEEKIDEPNDEKVDEPNVEKVDETPISVILRLSKALGETDGQMNVTDVLKSLREQINSFESELNSSKIEEAILEKELESVCDSNDISTEEFAFKPIIDDNLEVITNPAEKSSDDSEINSISISETVSQAVSEIAEFDITLSQISEVDISENVELCEKVKEIQTMSENVTKRCIEIIKNIQTNVGDSSAEFDELVLLTTEQFNKYFPPTKPSTKIEISTQTEKIINTTKLNEKCKKRMLESSSESSTSEYYDDASLDAANTVRRRRKKKKRATEENSENEVSISSSLETIIPKILDDDSKQDDILPSDLLEQSMTESPTNEDFNMDEFLVHKSPEQTLIKSESQIAIVNEPISDELNDRMKITTPSLSEVGSVDYNSEFLNNFDVEPADNIVKDEFIASQLNIMETSLEDQLNNIAAENIQKDEDERNDLDDDSEIEDQDERRSEKLDGDDLDDFNDKEIDRLLDFTALESKRTAGEPTKTDPSKHSKPAKKKNNVLDIIEDVGKEDSDESSSDDENIPGSEEQFLLRCNLNMKEKLLVLSSDSETNSEGEALDEDSEEDKDNDDESNESTDIDKFLNTMVQEEIQNSEKKIVEPSVSITKIVSQKENQVEKEQEKEEEEEIEEGEQSVKRTTTTGVTKIDSVDKLIFSNKIFKDIDDPIVSKPKEKSEKKTKNSSDEDSDCEILDISMFETKKKAAKESTIEAVEALLTASKRTKTKNPKSNEEEDCISLSSDSDLDEEKDEEDEEDENAKKRNIRAIMSEDQLTVETKQAQKEEDSRIRRLEKKNNMLSQRLSQSQSLSFDHEESSIVLDYDSKRKTNICVHPDIVKHLKEHQVDGIRFMYDNSYGGVDYIDKFNGSGCILAHCMGLGKTLQLIALLHTVIRYPQLKTNRVLVICPKSTVMNWSEEIKRWLSPIKNDSHPLKVFFLPDNSDIHDKCNILRDWHKSGAKNNHKSGCLLIGYEAFRTLVNKASNKKQHQNLTPRQLEEIGKVVEETLLNPGADLIICDEGHIIKNKRSAINGAISRVRTRRRIILTGTPIQNNLKEYFCMVDFIKPSFLGTEKEFANLYTNPINSGQHKDSTKGEIKFMKQRSFVLHKKLSKFVQRREAAVLKKFLPEKFEYVLFCPITKVQERLYEYFLENNPLQEKYGGKSLIPDYTFLRKIWTHPKVLENAWQNATVRKERQDAKRRKLNEEDAMDVPDDLLDKQTGHMSVTSDWWRQHLDPNDLESIIPSNKLRTMFEILKLCYDKGEKVLIFSAFVAVLDVVEFFMKKIHLKDKGCREAGLERFNGPWVLNHDYYRLDGKTSKSLRHAMITQFNCPTNHTTRCFLISSKAGGQGINLIGANRVIILDTSWNPSMDQQNIFRVFRLGQRRVCYIYRLLAMGTMEEKVYSRSVTKQAMSFRVVDEQQIDRHYNMAELSELYTLTKTDLTARPTPIRPVDDILASLLHDFPEMCYKYHEHDSLLENKPDQDLSENDKAEAWAAYENDVKNRGRPGQIEMFGADGLFPNYARPGANPQLPIGFGIGNNRSFGPNFGIMGNHSNMQSSLIQNYMNNYPSGLPLSSDQNMMMMRQLYGNYSIPDYTSPVQLGQNPFSYSGSSTSPSSYYKQGNVPQNTIRPTSGNRLKSLTDLASFLAVPSPTTPPITSPRPNSTASSSSAAAAAANAAMYSPYNDENMWNYLNSSPNFGNLMSGGSLITSLASTIPTVTTPVAMPPIPIAHKNTSSVYPPFSTTATSSTKESVPLSHPTANHVRTTNSIVAHQPSIPTSVITKSTKNNGNHIQPVATSTLLVNNNKNQMDRSSPEPHIIVKNVSSLNAQIKPTTTAEATKQAQKVKNFNMGIVYPGSKEQLQQQQQMLNKQQQQTTTNPLSIAANQLQKLKQNAQPLSTAVSRVVSTPVGSKVGSSNMVKLPAQPFSANKKVNNMIHQQIRGNQVNKIHQQQPQQQNQLPKPQNRINISTTQGPQTPQMKKMVSSGLSITPINSSIKQTTSTTSTTPTTPSTSVKLINQNKSNFPVTYTKKIVVPQPKLPTIGQRQPQQLQLNRVQQRQQQSPQRIAHQPQSNNKSNPQIRYIQKTTANSLQPQIVKTITTNGNTSNLQRRSVNSSVGGGIVPSLVPIDQTAASVNRRIGGGITASPIKLNNSIGASGNNNLRLSTSQTNLASGSKTVPPLIISRNNVKNVGANVVTTTTLGNAGRQKILQTQKTLPNTQNIVVNRKRKATALNDLASNKSLTITSVTGQPKGAAQLGSNHLIKRIKTMDGVTIVPSQRITENIVDIVELD